MAFVMLVLMFKWQVADNERFVALANERNVDIKIPSVRGSILAADGSTLAYSEPRYDVYIWLPDLVAAEKNNVQTRQEFVTKVAAVLKVDSPTVQDKFNTQAQWIKIADKVTYDTKTALAAIQAESNKSLVGLQYVYVNKRIYPEGKLAGQVLGYISLFDPEAKGTWGLEQYWDGVLRPLEGIQSTSLDSNGNPIALAGTQTIDSIPGATLYTTIDKTLQGILEEKLAQGYAQFQAQDATGIIVDPKTGAILAMANYPSFDPNKYYEVENADTFGNKAISDPYEIGSVAKTFTLAAALDLGRITPDTVLLPDGHNGCEIISPNPQPGDKCKSTNENKKSDHIIDCICVYNQKPVKRSITVFDALTSSDNIGFRHIALTMSYQEFYDYLVKFGAGQTTNVDLAGESYANLKNGKNWNYADQAVYSYGHGYSLTPLQTAMGMATIANDGLRMQPYVVSKIVDANNKVTQFQPKAVVQVIKPETAAVEKTMEHKVFLNQLIEKQFKNLSSYDVALKSGTALIPYTDRPGYSSEINTTFAGYDASPAKTFVLYVKLEKPQVGDLSYYNARILWLNTFEAIKDYLHVPQY